MHRPTAVDLFCGCGGVTEGLKRSRFKVVAAIDSNPIACKTYRRNHARVHLYNRDISEVDPQEIRHKYLGDIDLDLLVVCAPCQPFSSQSRRTRPVKEKLRLIMNAVDYARVLRPRLIFLENVPGLTRNRFRHIIRELRAKLEELGYVVGEPKIVDAADYGVPQRRKRSIMLAKRGGDTPSVPHSSTPKGRRTTVRDAIGDLRILRANERDNRDPLHRARNHSTISLERLSHIPEDGGSRDSLPDRLVLKCHVGYKGHPDVYGRMRWDDVAPTLTTGCADITRGRFAHPNQDRAITLREAARLQTFPDKYHFCGSASDIATQIGNAVPVRLIEELAPVFREAIRK